MSAAKDEDDAERLVDRTLALHQRAPERLLCIVGPTASGKTDLALRVSERLDGEVISADSVQIYRGFDIGSGKPSAAELSRVRHHLIDALDPMTTTIEGTRVPALMDASSWAKLADAALADIRARGKTPIVCGGTFFWVRALVLGLVEAPAADAAVRARHRAVVDAEGRGALHDELARVDPESAKRLHPNDVVRVSRALEVYEVSGRTMSSFQAEHGFKSSRHPATFIAIRHEADVLTARIARRVEAMLEGGFIEETRALLASGNAEARAMSSVGYAEVRAHLQGVLSRGELKDAIVRATRVFARRQRTWLNHEPVEWLSPGDG